MQEAQDSFEHSNTLPRESLSKSCSLTVWCFASGLYGFPFDYASRPKHSATRHSQ